MRKGKKQNYEGIIIRSFNYGEDNKIISVFTPNNGIVTAVVYGARKIKSRFRGKVETLNWIEGMFNNSSKSDMLVLEDIFLLYPFVNHLTFENVWNILPFMKFLTLLSFSNNMENFKVFQMFTTLLKSLENSKEEDKSKLLLYAFTLKVLISLSIVQNFKFCYQCGMIMNEIGFFNREEGIMVCDKCSQMREKYIKLDQKYFSFLIKIIYSKFDIIINFNITEDEISFLKDLVDVLIYHSFGKRWEDFEIQENPFDSKS